MPESASQRVTRAYRRGYLDALHQAALDANVRGDVGHTAGPSAALYLAQRANRFERDGVPRKEKP